jgi:transposase
MTQLPLVGRLSREVIVPSGTVCSGSNMRIDAYVRRAELASARQKRWLVERTLAWLCRCRRLAKDWEALNRKACAFLMMASIRLMVRRLCRSYA